MRRMTGCCLREAAKVLQGPRCAPARWVFIGALSWLSVVGAGMWIMWNHTLTAGQVAQAPGDWPLTSVLHPAKDRATVLMWCHPRCPCTRASLEELSELARHSRGRALILVSFVRPPGFSPQWVQGTLWRQAKAIPGVRVLLDEGHEARRFGVRTSGQTLIFGKDRNLLFSGGLASGRGHVGNSVGLATATRLVGIGTGKLERAPVFGCSLLDSIETGALDQREARGAVLLQEGRR